MHMNYGGAISFVADNIWLISTHEKNKKNDDGENSWR
jgi:hypothetical protein